VTACEMRKDLNPVGAPATLLLSISFDHRTDFTRILNSSSFSRPLRSVATMLLQPLKKIPIKSPPKKSSI
jgi:hypothetical protein